MKKTMKIATILAITLGFGLPVSKGDQTVATFDSRQLDRGSSVFIIGNAGSYYGSGKYQIPTFKVYATDETYNRKTIDDQISTIARSQQDLVKKTDAAIAAQKSAFDAMKTDVLDSISKVVGRQLSPEQVQQLEAAVEANIRQKLKDDLMQELKEQLKAEIIHDLRASKN